MKYSVVALLTIHVGLITVNILTTFPTRNEVGHLSAGVSHWRTGTFSLYNVNPPLWGMVAVLPVLPFHPQLPSVDSNIPGGRIEWQVSRLFAEANSVDYWTMIRLSRITGAVWSVLAGIVIYRWSRGLFGETAGLIGLTLWCFDPNIIAHASLLTSDMPLTLAVFAATYGFRAYLKQPSWEGAVLCGIALGLTQVTKFTALILYLVWPFLWFLQRTALGRRGACSPSDEPSRSENSSGEGDGDRKGAKATIGQLGILLVTSLIVINACYAFDGSFQKLKQFEFFSQALRDGEEHDRGGNRFRGSWLGEIPIPLPADFVRGLDIQRVDFEKGMPSYLDGEVRQTGWWYYYLAAFLYKVPLGTIILIILAAVLAFKRSTSRINCLDELFIWFPALSILTIVSSQTGFNHHFRYVLPVLPFFFVAASRVGLFFDRPRTVPSERNQRRLAGGSLPSFPAVAVTFLLGWTILSSVSVVPHSLAYFNEIAGGPDEGYKHLIDSNIDWGQDMWRLQKWVKDHPQKKPLSIAYLNYIEYKSITDLDFPRPPLDPPIDRAGLNPLSLQDFGPHPGYFAIDVHHLILGPYTYFQRFKPIEKAGYSIFIYHLTPLDVAKVRKEMGLLPLP